MGCAALPKAHGSVAVANPLSRHACKLFIERMAGRTASPSTDSSVADHSFCQRHAANRMNKGRKSVASRHRAHLAPTPAQPQAAPPPLGEQTLQGGGGEQLVWIGQACAKLSRAARCPRQDRRCVQLMQAPIRAPVTSLAGPLQHPASTEPCTHLRRWRWRRWWRWSHGRRPSHRAHPPTAPHLHSMHCEEERIFQRQCMQATKPEPEQRVRHMATAG